MSCKTRNASVRFIILSLVEGKPGHNIQEQPAAQYESKFRTFIENPRCNTQNYMLASTVGSGRGGQLGFKWTDIISLSNLEAAIPSNTPITGHQLFPITITHETRPKIRLLWKYFLNGTIIFRIASLILEVKLTVEKLNWKNVSYWTHFTGFGKSLKSVKSTPYRNNMVMPLFIVLFAVSPSR